MARFNSAQQNKILNAAIEVFSEKGLKGASIRLVAQAAGVNSALIYYYFENKQTLFVEAVRMIVRGLFEHLARNSREFTQPRERISFLVNGLFDYYGAHPARMQLMGVTFTLYPDILSQVIQSFLKEQVLLPLEVLQEGSNRGELRPVPAVQVWWSILGICLFNLLMRRVMKNIDFTQAPYPMPDMARGREEIINLLCDGLMARKS